MTKTVVYVVLSIVLAVWNSPAHGQLQPVPETVRLGALFDGNKDAAVEAAFLHGINLVNDDRSVLIRSRLSPAVDSTVPHSNSFLAVRKLCELLPPTGVAAVFGPTSDATARQVESITDTLFVPHIETRWDYSFKQRDFAFNIHPHPARLGKAFADLIAKYNWKSFVIIYEDQDSLVRLQEIIKLPKHYEGISIVLKQLDPHSNDYRPMLKQIKTSGEIRIVLDCKFEKIERIIKQADEIGLINDYYNYIITSLDTERLDLSPYKYVNVNITSFRMVDSNNVHLPAYLKKWNWNVGDGSARGVNHPLYSENVLMYDAVRVVAKALDELGNVEGFRVDPINCQNMRPWTGGSKIAMYLRRIDYLGLTGEITFDENGYRTNFVLDLIEKKRENMVKIGIWDPVIGVNFTRTQAEVDGQIIEKLQNKTLKITTTVNPPFIIRKDLPDVPKEALERMTFEEKYEGYCIDLIKKLAEQLKFKYKFQLVGDGNYGNLDENGEWNGMIKELIDQKADMAMIDLSITSERQKAVDFTMPYMHTGVGILYKKKAPPPPNLFSFLNPFSLDVWIYMTTLYLATSILMFLLARLTPYEWDNPHPCKGDPDELVTVFNVKNALWFGIGSLLCQGSDILPKCTPFEWEPPHPCPGDEPPEELESTLTLHNCFWHNWGSLMQQGSDIAPKAVSTRLVAGMWWFFTLIMISSYTANLAAFLTAAKMEAPINSADDLAKQSKIKFGTYCCGSTNAFFKSSTIPTYQKLNAMMESAKPSVYTDGNQEGIDRVRKEDGMYAFFMEATVIEYNLERKCDLTQIGGLLDSKGLGIALPKDSPYTSTISNGILKLQEAGVLQRLKVKWWKEMHGGGECVREEDGGDQLGLANIGGVFIVLLAGMILSCFIAVGEFVWRERIMIADPEQSMMKAMRHTIKFAIDLRAGDSKPVSIGKDPKVGSKSLLSFDAQNNPYGVVGGGEEQAETPASLGTPYVTRSPEFPTNHSNPAFTPPTPAMPPAGFVNPAMGSPMMPPQEPGRPLIPYQYNSDNRPQYTHGFGARGPQNQAGYPMNHPNGPGYAGYAGKTAPLPPLPTTSKK